MSNNPTKREVLIKHYLRSILDKNEKRSESMCLIKDLTYLCHKYQLLEETGQLLLAIAKDIRTKLEAA